MLYAKGLASKDIPSDLALVLGDSIPGNPAAPLYGSGALYAEA